jgi:hypothetical protein
MKDRRYCTKCGGHITVEHPTLGLIDVRIGALPNFPFKPRVHLNYEETVLPIKDDLPKLKDFPAAIGGVRRDNARIATPSCTLVRLFLDRMAGWILSRALANRPTNCWFVLFLDKEIITRLRSSRLVAISKTTGEIVYDGDANDEG